MTVVSSQYFSGSIGAQPRTTYARYPESLAGFWDRWGEGWNGKGARTVDGRSGIPPNLGEDRIPWSNHSLIYLTHTHTRLTALFPGLPRWAGTRKVKPIWILLKQETMSGSGISWARCKSAPSPRQTTTPAPHHSIFYRPDALLATKPTASKHWRQSLIYYLTTQWFTWQCWRNRTGTVCRHVKKVCAGVQTDFTCPTFSRWRRCTTRWRCDRWSTS